MSWVLKELEEKPDLFSDQNYTANRDQSNWESCNEKLDPIWKKLIKSEYIREVIQQIDPMYQLLMPNLKTYMNI